MLVFIDNIFKDFLVRWIKILWYNVEFKKRLRNDIYKINLIILYIYIY